MPFDPFLQHCDLLLGLYQVTLDDVHLHSHHSFQELSWPKVFEDVLRRVVARELALAIAGLDKGIHLLAVLFGKLVFEDIKSYL